MDWSEILDSPERLPDPFLIRPVAGNPGGMRELVCLGDRIEVHVPGQALAQEVSQWRERGLGGLNAGTEKSLAKIIARNRNRIGWMHENYSSSNKSGQEAGRVGVS